MCLTSVKILVAKLNSESENINLKPTLNLQVAGLLAHKASAQNDEPELLHDT